MLRAIVLRFMPLAATALLFCVPVAAAKTSNVPPGNSGIDQYRETIPNSSGSGGSGSGSGGSSGHKVLTRGEQQALAKQGADGAAVAALAESDGVPRATRAANRRTSGEATSSSRGATAATASSGDSTVGALSRALIPTGGSGMGVLLPALLLGTVGLGAAAVVTRRRSS